MQEESMMSQQENSWNAELPNIFYYNGSFSIFHQSEQVSPVVGT